MRYHKACAMTALLLFSCGSWMFPPLEVLSIETGQDIAILFSSRPSALSIKKAMSVSRDGSQISGQFLFNDRLLRFVPFDGLPAGHEYSVLISTAAEDEKGNSLLENFSYHFNTKTDTEAPKVISVYPEDGHSLDGKLEEIKVEFSKAVDTLSFMDAIQINPAMEYISKWSGNDTIVSLVPAHPPALGTRYFICLSEALCDKNKNCLEEPFSSSFLYGTDTEAPELCLSWSSADFHAVPLADGCRNSGIASDAEILFAFNEPVAIDAIAGLVEIQPGISYSLLLDHKTKKEAKLVFAKRPEWNREYLLKLSAGASDLSGNKMRNELSFKLLFDSEAFRPVVFESGFLLNGIDNWVEINRDTEFSDILLDASVFQPSAGIGQPTKLFMVFRISECANALSLVAVMNAIKVSSTNACVDISVKAIRILSREEYELSEVYGFVPDSPDGPDGTEGGKLSIAELDLELENSCRQGFVIFSIDNTLKDTLGNAMTEACVLTYNKY
ncbi:hypothetical protein MASR2M29_20430 [Spirochaetota bacterium]